MISVGMSLAFMKRSSSGRGMRRKREPGTRKPCRRPLSKQRMMVCCETLQISAASPVVKTCLSAQVGDELFLDISTLFLSVGYSPYGACWIHVNPPDCRTYDRLGIWATSSETG